MRDLGRCRWRRLAAGVTGGFVVGLLLLGAQAAAPAEPADIEAEFAAICRQVRESYDPFYGELRSREIVARIEAGVADPVERAALEALLGREHLKLARTAEAIALLQGAAGEKELNPDLRLDTRVHLGLAYLQAAEDENCILSHTADSCLLPIRPGGVHRQPSNARKAGDTFLAIAREHPRAVQTLWLLNLARMISGDYPEGVPQQFRLPVGAMQSGEPFPRWLDRAPELGVAVVDLAGGAAMDDFDGDGLLDLVTSTWDPCGGMKAFRNDGKGGFEDVSKRWALDRQSPPTPPRRRPSPTTTVMVISTSTSATRIPTPPTATRRSCSATTATARSATSRQRRAWPTSASPSRSPGATTTTTATPISTSRTSVRTGFIATMATASSPTSRRPSV
jgi:hypothetical protein